MGWRIFMNVLLILAFAAGMIGCAPAAAPVADVAFTAAELAFGAIFWSHNWCGDHRVLWDTVMGVLGAILTDDPRYVTYFQDHMRIKWYGTDYRLVYNDLGTIMSKGSNYKWGEKITDATQLAARKTQMQRLARLWRASKPTTFESWQRAVRDESRNYTDYHCRNARQIPVPAEIPVPVAQPAPEPPGQRIIPDVYVPMSDGSVLRGYQREGITFIVEDGISLSEEELKALVTLAAGIAVAGGCVLLVLGTGGLGLVPLTAGLAAIVVINEPMLPVEPPKIQ